MSLEPVAIARSIVGHSVLVRKTEQSINWGSVAILVVCVIVGPAWWLRLAGHTIQRGNDKAAARMTAQASGNPDTLGAYMGTPAVVSMDGVFSAASTAAIQNGMATIQAGITPTIAPTLTPTPTQGLHSQPVQLKLSFYDPNIGKYFPDNPKVGQINCALWDTVSLTCNSTMADGSPFALYYGKAAACPPPMQNGDLLRVSYPTQLAGDWICMDRGWAIDRGYIDFLLRYPDMVWTGYDLNSFPWWSTVRAEWVHP